MSPPGYRGRNQTLEDLEPGSLSWTRHPELYIQDGSITILCENTIFKVPGGILAMNSQVFKDMLTLESNQPADAETYDGCPLVRLSDDVKDVEALMKALFVAEYIPVNGKLPPFDVVASILRLSTKYMAHGLRNRMIHLLSVGYHTTFERFVDAKVDGEDIFQPDPPHPNRVLNLFRECGLREFLPFAFYRVCVSMESIFNAEEGNRLPHEDLRAAALGLSHFQWAQHITVTYFHASSPLCTNPKGRRRAAETKERRLNEALQKNPSAQYWQLTGPPYVECCQACSAEASSPNTRDYCRKRFWYELPRIFGLPSWEALSSSL